MNPLHDAFERRARYVGTPDLDIDMLVGRGEATLRRRRRIGASVGGAIAVVVAIAVVLAGGQNR